MNEFPPDWHKSNSELKKARAWLPEIPPGMAAGWTATLEVLLNGVPMINAGNVMQNKWLSARIDDHPFSEDVISRDEELGPLFDDKSLEDYVKRELEDARPLISGGWSRNYRDSVDRYHLSIRNVDPENPDFLLTTEYHWDIEQGYVITARTLVSDMLKSNLSGWNDRAERRIRLDDQLTVEALLGVLAEETEKDKVVFNG